MHAAVAQLFRDLELVGALSSEVSTKAKATIAEGGAALTTLLDAGVSLSAVLLAASKATELPIAVGPTVTLPLRLDETDAFAARGLVAFLDDSDQLAAAYGAIEEAVRAQPDLPAHRRYLANPQDIRTGLSTLSLPQMVALSMQNDAVDDEFAGDTVVEVDGRQLATQREGRRGPGDAVSDVGSFSGQALGPMAATKPLRTVKPRRAVAGPVPQLEPSSEGAAAALNDEGDFAEPTSQDASFEPPTAVSDLPPVSQWPSAVWSSDGFWEGTDEHADTVSGERSAGDGAPTERSGPRAEVVDGDEAPDRRGPAMGAGVEASRPRDADIATLPGLDPQPIDLDNYRCVRRLARGDEADVYLAVDVRFGRPAVIRVITGWQVDDAVAGQLRVAAAKLMELQHPHIVRCLDAGVSGRTPYVVAEHVTGGSLAALLRSVGPLPPTLAVLIFDQLLKALSAAHDDGVAHLDVTPENFLITGGGEVRLADLSHALSAVADTSGEARAIIGDPAYLSPERARGRRGDHRSDLYAAGMVLFELLTGAHPSAPVEPQRGLQNVHQRRMPSLLERAPWSPLLLSDVLQSLLRLDPSDRFASAAHVRAALKPLVRAMGRACPGALSRLPRAPDEAVADLRRDQALAELAHAEALMAAGSDLPAALRVHRARLLAPNHPRVRAAKLPAGTSLELPPPVPDVEPGSASEMLEAARDCRRRGNPLGMLVWAARAETSHADPEARALLGELLGPDPSAPLDQR